MRLECHASQLMNHFYLLYSGKLAFTYHTCTTYWFWNWVTLACHASQVMNSTYVLPIHNHLHYVFFLFVCSETVRHHPFGAIAWDSSLGFLLLLCKRAVITIRAFCVIRLYRPLAYVSQTLWLRFGALLCQVDGLLTKSIGFLDQKVVWGDIPVREVMHTVYPHHLQAEMVL